MCGIVGFTSNGHDPAAAKRTAQAMADLIRHRGPDGDGTFLDGTQAGFAWAAQVAAELLGNAPPPPAPQTMPAPDTEKTKTINA